MAVFQLHAAGLNQVFLLSRMLCCDWLVFHSCYWHVLILNVSELFLWQLAVVRLSFCCVFFMVGIHASGISIPLFVDIVRVKSYVNSLFVPASIPVRIMINKLNLIPKQLVSGVVGVL